MKKVVYVGNRADYVDHLFGTFIVFPRGEAVEVEDDNLARKLLKMDDCFRLDGDAQEYIANIDKLKAITEKERIIEEQYQAEVKADEERFMRVFCDLKKIASAGAICNFAVKQGIAMEEAKKIAGETMDVYRERITKLLWGIIDEVEKKTKSKK